MLVVGPTDMTSYLPGCPSISRMIGPAWKIALPASSTGSFSSAAQKLYIAQPSLSQFVKRIETKIGAELFDRSASPITLTDAGEIYLETERQLHQLAKARQQQIDDLGTLTRGRVVIGSSNYRSSYFLTQVLPIVRQRWPNIEIRLEEGTTAELEEAAQSGKTDFSIVLHPLTKSGLDSVEIFREEILLALDSCHPLCQNLPPAAAGSRWPEPDWSRLTEEPFIIIRPGQKMRQSFFDLCQQVHIAPPIILETQSMPTALRLTAVGVGATLTTDLLAHTMRFPGLAPRYFTLTRWLPHRRALLTWRSGRYLSKAARAVIQVMQETGARI